MRRRRRLCKEGKRNTTYKWEECKEWGRRKKVYETSEYKQRRGYLWAGCKALTKMAKRKRAACSHVVLDVDGPCSIAGRINVERRRSRRGRPTPPYGRTDGWRRPLVSGGWAPSIYPGVTRYVSETKLKFIFVGSPLGPTLVVLGAPGDDDGSLG
jgi:hypothetical protein